MKSSMTTPRAPRVAIIDTHPIQYHTPWFRALARRTDLELTVLYCHKSRPQDQAEAGFGVEFEWDVSLMDGYRWEYVPNVASKPGTNSFWGVDNPELANKIARGEFDTVVLNGWHYKSAWQAMQACWRSGTAIMGRGDSNLRTPRSAVKTGAKWPFYRFFISRLDAGLPAGAWSREYFLHYGARPERVFEVPHTVDSDRISGEAARWMEQRGELRRKWDLSEDEMVFVFLGKLIAKKRPLDFIRAIGQARRMGAKVIGLIVGDGVLRQDCEAEAVQSGTPIRFAGFLNQTEIIKAYVAADALALPSDAGETWGLVVNEAMVCGRPCFLSDQVGCSPDLIDQGKTGATFPCADVDRFAALLKQYADRDTLLKMGEQARDKIAAYTPATAAGQLADAVRISLANGKTGAWRKP
jgi:glycosyltransferase involved in cell wall biosynthesis